MPKNELGDLLIVDTLSRIDGKLDRLDERIDNVDKTMARQQEILVEHIRRTNLLEQKLDHDVAVVKDSAPKVIGEEIRLTRNRYLLNIAKGLAALAGTGLGVGAIKTGLVWILESWK